MKTVGFFRELGPEPVEVYAESIHDHLAASPLPDATLVTRYLRDGHGLIDVMGAERDVLGSGRFLVGGASVMTDGTWLWRDDLQFYLATYHVRLPEEFLALVRANDYQVPDLPIEELRAASKEAMRILGYHQAPFPPPP
ncbi:hypothetical protein [Micromonospora halophytica]|uniref:Uncharacterized protein n=1 Tax=Micromonospora halophytica TaxID=47864 RepID=A0A1C5IBP5_9ACTN|nr:hypothetical protein [Micromonospora halophytica]SCG55493.1 hypothetical protein GA0070560_109163 [Micromonospora halophytica]